MRLIDADSLKKEVENLVAGGAERLKDYYENGTKSDENSWIGGVYDAWELINNAPTVEAYTSEDIVKYISATEDLVREKYERPQGEWIKHISELYPNESTEECPFCHEEQTICGNDDNFCPNCGAKMKGGAE